jgi:hypothetical protein
MPQFSDDLYLGPVPVRGAVNPGPSPNSYGVGPMGRTFTYDVVAAAAATATVAALQTTAGAGSLVLTAGAGVTQLVNAFGELVLRLDCPRALSLTSAGNISGVNFTITGRDVYGQLMTQTRAGPNANTVNTTKAFSEIISIAVSGAVGTNTSVGVSSILGLPFRITDAGYIVKAGWAGVLAQDAGTFTAADVTSPATASTGDVRGTYLPSSAADGTRRLVFTYVIPGIASGPNATETGLYGVAQA